MVGRRKFLGSMVGATVAAMGAPALSAFASTTTGWGGGFTGWVYNGGDAGIAYAYLFAGPGTDYAWVGNVPVGTSVNVIGYGNGPELAPHNPIWYQVQSPQGTGYVYSGLITNFAPVTAPAAALALPPGPVPGPATNGVGRSISISLSRQHIYAYDGTALVFDSIVTTGNPILPTPTGLYRIMTKQTGFVFRSPWPPGSPYWYPDSPTNYAMLFRDGGYFIHDAPWRPYYGPGTNFPHMEPDGVVRQGSHGCVNVPLQGEIFLFTFASIGTPVLVIN